MQGGAHDAVGRAPGDRRPDERNIGLAPRSRGGFFGFSGAQHGRRRAFLDDHTILDADDAVGMAGHVVVVGDKDDGDAFLAVELLEHPEHVLGGVRIEVARGFVGQQERRPVDQRAWRWRRAVVLAETPESCDG